MTNKLGTCRLVSRPHPQTNCGKAWRPLPESSAPRIPAIPATKESELISAIVELMRDYHVKADSGFLYAVVKSVNSILGK